MEYFFSKILKSWICPWFEEWSYFPWIFRFNWYKLHLHFVEAKNLRVDSSGDLDFPQLENSLQVKPFLLTPIALIRHKKTQIQKPTHTLCHPLYPSHLCRESHVTLTAWGVFVAVSSWARTLSTAIPPQVCLSSSCLSFDKHLLFRQTARAKSNPAVSGLQPGHHPHLHSGHVLLVPLAKSRHQVGVLHIVVTITSTMANIIFTNSIFSIYEAANIHSILDCRERGAYFWCTDLKFVATVATGGRVKFLAAV